MQHYRTAGDGQPWLAVWASTMGVKCAVTTVATAVSTNKTGRPELVARTPPSHCTRTRTLCFSTSQVTTLKQSRCSRTALSNLIPSMYSNRNIEKATNHATEASDTESLLSADQSQEMLLNSAQYERSRRKGWLKAIGHIAILTIYGIIAILLLVWGGKLRATKCACDVGQVYCKCSGPRQCPWQPLTMLSSSREIRSRVSEANDRP